MFGWLKSGNLMRKWRKSIYVFLRPLGMYIGMWRLPIVFKEYGVTLVTHPSMDLSKIFRSTCLQRQISSQPLKSFNSGEYLKFALEGQNDKKVQTFRFSTCFFFIFNVYLSYKRCKLYNKCCR